MNQEAVINLRLHLARSSNRFRRKAKIRNYELVAQKQPLLSQSRVCNGKCVSFCAFGQAPSHNAKIEILFLVSCHETVITTITDYEVSPNWIPVTSPINPLRKPPRDDYLEQIAFKEGEFDDDSKLFQAASEELAHLISTRIESYMQSVLGQDIAATWVDAACQILHEQLPERIAEPEQAMMLRNQLAQLLAESLPRKLGADTIAREIADVSHHLGQTVLSRWSGALQDANRDGVLLNENLMPAGKGFVDLLSGVDLEPLCVSSIAVIEAMNEFRDLKVKQAESSVIALGPKAYVKVVGVGKEKQLFCFQSMAKAMAAPSFTRRRYRPNPLRRDVALKKSKLSMDWLAGIERGFKATVKRKVYEEIMKNKINIIGEYQSTNRRSSLVQPTKVLSGQTQLAYKTRARKNSVG